MAESSGSSIQDAIRRAQAGESVVLDPSAAQAASVQPIAAPADPGAALANAIGSQALGAGEALAGLGNRIGSAISGVPAQTMPQAQPQAVPQTRAPAEQMPDPLQADPVAVVQQAVQKKDQIEQQVAQEVAQESAIQQIERQAQEDTQRAVARVDEEIKAIGPQQLSDYFNQGSIWSKVLAGISLGVGGYYSGAYGRENPALSIMNKEIENNQALKKLKQDERNKLIAAQADLLAQRLKAFEADPNRNPMARMKAEEARLALEKTKADIIKTQAETREISRKATGAAIGVGSIVSDANQLPPDQRELAVVLPDGRVALAINKNQAEAFNKFQADVAPALNGIARVDKLIQDFNRVTDLTQRGKIQTELQALVGQLRLPFVGPGALTDQEYERLKDTIGDPTKLAAFPSVQRAKLQQVRKKLQSDYADRLKQAGISLKKEQLGFAPEVEAQISAMTKAVIDKAVREGKKVPSEDAVRKAIEKRMMQQ